MNGTGTVIPLPLPYLYRTFVDVFLTHTVPISTFSGAFVSEIRYCLPEVICCYITRFTLFT